MLISDISFIDGKIEEPSDPIPFFPYDYWLSSADAVVPVNTIGIPIFKISGNKRRKHRKIYFLRLCLYLLLLLLKS